MDRDPVFETVVADRNAALAHMFGPVTPLPSKPEPQGVTPASAFAVHVAAVTKGSGLAPCPHCAGPSYRVRSVDETADTLTAACMTCGHRLTFEGWRGMKARAEAAAAEYPPRLPTLPAHHSRSSICD